MSDCPLTPVHRRLEDAHRLWHRAVENYFDPEEFRADAQLLIQTLRTVTWILHKNKDKVPEFESWYAVWAERLADDPIMRWAKNARNKIEKQGDLESKSFIRAEVIASYLDDGPCLEVEAHLFDDPTALLRGIPDEVLEKQVFRHGALRVERRWVANDLPDYELLDALAYVYGRLSEVLYDAHLQASLQVDDLELNGRAPCMIGHEERRSMVLSLATGEQLQLASKSVEVNLAECAERYGMPPPAPEANSVDQLALRTFEWARHVFLKDGYHIPILFLLRGSEVVEHYSFEAQDRLDKYLLMRHYAHEAVRRSADGVMLISEAWTAERQADPYLYASDVEDRGEALSLYLATKSSQVVVLSATIAREGEEVRLGETTQESGFPMTFAPFYEAWGVQPSDAVREWARRSP